jgi:hypothetical protein
MNFNGPSVTELPPEATSAENHVGETNPQETERIIEDPYRVVMCDEHGDHNRYLECEFTARVHREEEQKALAEFMARAKAD